LNSERGFPSRTVLAAACVVLLLVTGCGKQPEAPAAPPSIQVSVAEVATEDVPIYGEWVGEARGRADIEIRARVTGFLTGLHFLEGGLVKKGQLLYTIDQSELLESVAASQARLAAAKTELAYAETDVARYRPLAEINAVSRRDLDSAVAREDAARAGVEAAEAMLRLAEIDLSYSNIKSPMDGLIGLTKAKVGDYVGQSPNPVVLNTVSDINPIHVRFPIGEREYLDLARRIPPEDRDQRPGEQRNQIPLELILADGTVHPHPGHAKFVERSVDASTGTLTVEAEFPNPEGLLRPGLYGKVRTVIEVLHGALLIPQRAVSELQGLQQVWVVGDNGAVELRNVRMGRRVNSMWVVEDGLAAGESVVVDGIQRMRAGATVVTQPWQPPAVPAEAGQEG